MKIFLVILGCVALGVIVFIFVIRESSSSVGKPCSICRVPSSFGYSEHAEEDTEKLKPLCLAHLIPEIEKDYERFRGRAVVIEPADGPPCYVFQPVEEWRKAFKNSKIADDVSSLLLKMDTKCHECKQTVVYLWVGSKGLTGDNFVETLDKGLSATLLRHNPSPISLCSKCCVKRVISALRAKHLSYLELCAPKGNTDGFVIPMGY